MRLNLRSTVVATLLAATLAACGGGGNGTATSSPGATSSTSALEIIEHPAAATLIDGQAATLSVKITGAISPVYQWTRNGIDIPGATGASYTAPLVTTANSGDVYAVHITDGDREVTSNTATLTVTELPKVARASLASNVRVLTDQENALITSSTASEIVIAGTLTLPDGTVVLGANRAFKVTASRVANGQTTLTVTEPELSELFDTLRISGTYAADASNLETTPVTPSSTGRVRPLANSLDYTFTQSDTLAYGGLTTNATQRVGFSTTIDYNFDQAAGGLQTARFDLTSKYQVTLAVAYAASTQSQAEKPIARYRIPINLTLADAALRTIGIRVVSVQIPIYLGMKGSAKFALDAQGTVTANGAVRVLYDKQAGATSNAQYDGGFETGTVSATSPGGAPTYATFGLTGSVYVRTTPGLVFLNSVAMLGVDSTLSSDNAGQLQVTGSTPGYCLSFTPSVSVSANGYFKGVGFSEVKTRSFSSTLFKGDPSYHGACLAATKLTGKVSQVTATAFGHDLTVDVNVDLDPQATSSPSTGPTGKVKVSAAGSECTVTLHATSLTSARGSCTLAANAAGTSVELKTAYSGDLRYSPATEILNAELPATDGLTGAAFAVRADYPTIGSALTDTITGRVGPGVELSSGNFTVLQSGHQIIGEALDLGHSFIDAQFTQSAVASTGAFNGWVIDFDTSSPVIQSCQLGPLSSYTASQVGVVCSAHQVKINGSGIITTPGSRIYVQLGF